MKPKWICFIVFIPVCILVFAVLSGCSEILSDNTSDYILPARLITLTGMSPEEHKDSIENDLDSFSEEVIINGDGSITVRCTEEQRVKWVDNFQVFHDETLPLFPERYHISATISDDRTEVEIFVNPDIVHPQDFLTVLRLTVSECYIYQIFSDIPPDDCLIHFSVINEKTGNVVGAETFPGEGKFQLDPEDWK